MSLMTQQLNKDTGKFWSFKDTKHYKKASYKKLCNDRTQRRFIFEKSFLLQVYDSSEDTYQLVMPLHFQTDRFPDGKYFGITSEKLKMYFNDKDILRVIDES